jgi:ribonuclease E
MNRAEPQRRRRNRGRKPEPDATSGTGNTLNESLSETVEHVLTASTVVAATPIATPSSQIEDGFATLAEAVPSEQVRAAQFATLESMDSEHTDGGWAEVPASNDLVAMAADSAEPAVTVADITLAIEPIKVPPITEKVMSTAGITANGRAYNDPRVDAHPVGAVEVTTSRRTLFNEVVHPPAPASNRSVPRASNDPRGPRPEPFAAHAAGHF